MAESCGRPAPGPAVPAALDGERVDRAVALLTGLSRSEVNDLIARGGVALRGEVVVNRASKVRAGDRLKVEQPTGDGPPAPRPDPSVEVEVVWSDTDIAVVDKPAGVVVHPGAGRRSGTLVEGLLARFPELPRAGGHDERPGIVHRLDKGTSGLLVVALNDRARRRLTDQLASRRVERRYTALAEGLVEADEGLVDAPLGRSDRDPTLVTVKLAGRPARTSYRVQARYGSPVAASLLECRLETGRTHQIRVHLAAIGHPVAGDDRYRRKSPVVQWPGLSPGRLFLHARYLSFAHPATSERMEFSSPLPAELGAVLAAMQHVEG